MDRERSRPTTTATQAPAREVASEAPSRIQFQRGGAIPPVGSAFQAKAVASPSDQAFDAETDTDDPETPASRARVHKVGATLDRFRGDSTLDAVMNAGKILKQGDTGTAVRKLQQALFDLGYTPIAVTGTYDAATEQSVKALQGNAKLPQSGAFDSAAYDAMDYRLEDRTIYAGDAQIAAPNVHATPRVKGQPEAPPPAELMKHTRTLDAGDVVDANAAMTSPKQSLGEFHRALPSGDYIERLGTLTRAHVEEQYKKYGPNVKDRHSHSGTLYKFGEVQDVANSAKSMTDQVFGSYAVGPKFTSDNLKDKFADETAAHAKMDKDDRFETAVKRVRYILNTEHDIEALNTEFGADRTREPEQTLIKGVIARTAADLEQKLLDIEAGWSGSHDSGVVKIQMFKKPDDEGNREQLWRKFQTLVHEYCHALASPAFRTWLKGKSKADPEAGITLREGVAELLTRTVLSVVDPFNKDVRKAVEGKYYDGDAPPPDLVPRGYGTQLARAESLVGVVGIHNVYAAYFLGQVQLIGG